jgi:hypothetical protein
MTQLTPTMLKQARELREKSRNQHASALRLEQRARWGRRSGSAKGLKVWQTYQAHLIKSATLSEAADKIRFGRDQFGELQFVGFRKD